MRLSCLLILSLCLCSCSSSKKAQPGGSSSSSSSDSGTGDTRTKKVEYLNKDTYKLVETTEDKTYGYDQKNPIMVGGAGEGEGPSNERRFLNGLAGSNGETVKYYRMGSCCYFKTPNGTFNNTGLLDRYAVYWEGGKDTAVLYINMYDKGDLKIPVGFKAKG